MTTPTLTTTEAELAQRYEAFQAMQLKLDMTRGKPASEQLDLSQGLLESVTSTDFLAPDGTDTRNYGGLEGLPEMRTLFGELFGVPASQVLIGGNASLTLMFDTLVRAHIFGVPGGARPWAQEAKVKWICPVPGYDRHFGITAHFGYELVLVPMQGDGPDLDLIEELVKDPAVKGMWLVPKYSNPTGECISDEKVVRLARMQTAAPDFRLFWDDAYSVHHLDYPGVELANILDACTQAGHPDRVFLFASTSKISHAGAGVSAMAASPTNMAWTKLHAGKQSIGPDKINQLRHIRFFKNLDGIHAHMRKHAAILKPKFETVNRILSEELSETGLASWVMPKGGYFISLDTQPHQAREVVRLAAEAGVKLTAAGATFPHGIDPQDRNIRLSPSCPTLAELELATRVVATCVKLAYVRSKT